MTRMTFGGRGAGGRAGARAAVPTHPMHASAAATSAAHTADRTYFVTPIRSSTSASIPRNSRMCWS